MNEPKNSHGVRVILWGVVIGGAGVMLGQYWQLRWWDTAYLTLGLLIGYIVWGRWWGGRNESGGDRRGERADNGTKTAADLVLPLELTTNEERRAWLDDFLLRQQKE